MKFTATEICKNNTWQIGTGDGTRSYFDIFLRYGVALVGPGDPGMEGSPEAKLFYAANPYRNNWGEKLKKVKKDEWLIARKGKQTILAIGRVTEEYDYSNLFSDVEGWDLQHFVKVKWYKPDTKNEIIEFDNLPLGQSTLQGCNNAVVFDEIYKTEFKEAKNEFNVEDLILPADISIDKIVSALIDSGVRIQDAENIGFTLNRIVRLTDWYLANDGESLEIEIVFFLVVPLLIALGWSEQKIKIEYNNIDVALFHLPFKGNYKTSPEIIIEAKTFGNGLAFTGEQIKTYAEKYPECKKFIATNGFRYKYFEKLNGKMEFIGYFNLIDLKERNVLYDVPHTSVETILKLATFN